MRARFVCLLAMGAWHAATAEAAGRCAYVDVSLFGMADPTKNCFQLDMTCATDKQYGCFKGLLEFKSGWAEGQLRELSAPFGYIDPDGTHWDVPAGFKTDGASIPLFFQAVIGGRWTENYIKAAVVHDFYIRRPTADPAAVHKVFYLALLAAGNSQRRAQEMYFAVAKFGPQWKHTDVTVYEKAWRARKALLDRITKWHEGVWNAFQESERRREQQAAIDRAVLSRPLSERTHVFRVPETEDALTRLEDFIDRAVADHLLHADRDATLIKLFREKVDTEMRRPANERDNVFVVQFTTLGATTVSFAARSEPELTAQLDSVYQFTRAQEQVDHPPALCMGNCAAPP